MIARWVFAEKRNPAPRRQVLSHHSLRLEKETARVHNMLDEDPSVPNSSPRPIRSYPKRPTSILVKLRVGGVSIRIDIALAPVRVLATARERLDLLRAEEDPVETGW